MINTSILTTEYLIPISSLWLINNSDLTLVEYLENYQKKSTRNRAKIMSPNGIEVLSVPLAKGKNSKMPISEVEISYDNNWIENHLSSIKTAYSNSPYYIHYIDEFTEILNIRHPKLIDLNHSLTEFFIRSFNLEKSTIPTSTFERIYPEGYIDLRNASFSSRVIKGYFPRRYIQVFEEKNGFLGGLSALDLLMCLGPEGIFYL